MPNGLAEPVRRYVHLVGRGQTLPRKVRKRSLSRPPQPLRFAEPVAVEQVDEVGESELDLHREAERAEAKHAHELAREPYLSLTKAELSVLLAEWGLPKTGTVGRLVAADAK
jgi:hypothetical protein